MAAPSSDPDAERLRDLVASVLDKMEDEGEAALDSACRANPELASKLRSRVGKLAGIGLAPATEQSFPEELGDFRLIERLGSGGMGVVFRASQKSLQREVAVKVIRPEHMFFSGSRDRFRREADAVARLAHPSIVGIHAVGEENGVPYFAMELVRGCTLADLVGAVASSDPSALTGDDVKKVVARFGGVAPEAVEQVPSFGQSWTEVCLTIIRKVAEALDHAHSRGVLHRDLKPSNVMLTPEGRVVLMDFGLAFAEGAQKLTRTGAMLGSVPYMAPEQLRGTTQAVGPRTDIYSLGVVLYELLSLQPPYLAPTSDGTRELVLAGDPKPLRERNAGVSWEAETICLCAMDRDQARRYASAGDLVRDIDAYLAHRPVVARRPGAWLRTRRIVQRHPVATVVAVLGTLLLLLGPFAYAFGLAQQRDEALLARAAAELQSYASRVAVADVSLRIDDAAGAKRSLVRCPESLRGFEWHYLLGQSDTARRKLALPGTIARKIAFLPGGEELVALDANGALWRVPRAGERPATKIAGAPQKALGIAAHPELARLAVVAEQGVIAVVDLAGEVRSPEFERIDGASACSFAPDGKKLVVATKSRSYPVLDAQTGARCGEIKADPGFCAPALGTLQSGEVVMAGRGSDGRLTLFALDDGQPVRRFDDTYTFTSFAINRSATLVAATTGIGLVRVHRIDVENRSLTVSAHMGGISALAFGEDYMLLTGHGDGTVRAWNAISQGEAIGVYRGHEGMVYDIAVTRDEVAASSNGAPIRLWGVGDFGGARQRAIQWPWLEMFVMCDFVTASAIAPNGKDIAFGIEDGTVMVRSDETLAPRCFYGHERVVTGLAFTDGGASLWSSAQDGTLRKWEVSTGKELQKIECPGHAPCNLAVDRAGTTLFTAGADQTARAFSSGGKQLWKAACAGAYTSLLALGADQRTLFTRGQDGVLHAYRDGVEVASPERAAGAPPLAGASFAGVIAQGAKDSTARYYDLVGRPMISVSPEGKRLLCGAEGGAVRVLDAETGDVMLTLETRGWAINAVWWSPSGDSAWASLRNGWIAQWTGLPFAALPPEQVSVRELRPFERRVFAREFARTVAELIARIDAADDVSDAVKKAARADAAARGDDPRRFSREARRHLLFSEERPDSMQRGLLYAKAAVRALPESQLAHALLATAQFRLGSAKEARAALETAKQLAAKDPLGVHPLTLGADACLLAREKKHDEAQAKWMEARRESFSPVNGGDRSVQLYVFGLDRVLAQARK